MLVDGSLSSELTKVLPILRPLIEEIGNIKVGKVFLLQKQAQDLSEIIANEGFVPVIIHDDLDIHFALEAMEFIYNEKIATLALATENEKLLPLFSRARELGKEIVLLYTTDTISRGLQNAADQVLPITKL